MYEVRTGIGLDALKAIVADINKKKHKIVSVTQEGKVYTIICATSDNF